MARKTAIKTALCAGLALAAGNASAGINSWTMTGPDAGQVTTIAVHPANSEIAIASTSRGLHRTSDHGGHWTLVSESGARNISFDPTDPNRVYAAGSGIWLSTDAGASFTRATEPEFGVRQVELSSTGTIYAATFWGRVYKSVDDGASWTTCAAPWPGNVGSNTFAVDPNPNVQDHLFIEILTTDTSIAGTWRSIDGCASWIQAGAGSPGSGTDGRAYTYSVMPGNPDRVLAATNTGVRLSTDGGATWTNTTNTLAGWVQFDPVTPGNAVALRDRAQILRSSDNGSTWSAGGNLRIEDETQVVYDTQVAGRLWAVTLNGPYLSVDGGASFTLRNTGIRAGFVNDFSAADDGTVYASYWPGAVGVFRRDPVTLQWSSANNAALSQASTADNLVMKFVATAPTNSSVVYAGLDIASLVRSGNSGASWQPEQSEFINAWAPVMDTEVDPDSALVAYTATANQGIWKTVDGGLTWNGVNTGLPPITRMVAPARGSDVVYAIGSTQADPYTEHVYKSLNGGASWTQQGATPIPPLQGRFQQLVIDPNDVNIVYAPFHYGVYRTVDGGATWALMNVGQPSGSQLFGQSVLVDPDFSSTIMVSNVNGTSIARTVDGGANWEHIPFVDASQRGPGRAILDPIRPNVIIAGITGAGVGEYEVATDLAVSLDVPSPLTANAVAPANLLVVNLGPHGASPSEVTVTLPAWATPTVPSNCTRVAQTLTCSIPAVRANTYYTQPMSFAVPAADVSGQISATLVTHETDLDASNNTRSLQVATPEDAELVLAMTPTPAFIDPGATTSLVAALTNRGPSPSTLTTLSMSIPPGLSVENVATSVGSCTTQAAAIDCVFGTLAANTAAVVTVELLGVAPGTHVVSGYADGASPDRDSENAGAAIVVRPVADISVALAESADPVTWQTTFSYTATVRNLSGHAGGVNLVMPVLNANVLSMTPSSGGCAINLITVHCSIPSLAAGDAATVEVVLDAPAPGIVTATATANFAGTDPDPANNSASIGTNIRVVGDLRAEVTGRAGPVNLDQPFSYTVTVLNAGPNTGSAQVVIPLTNVGVPSVSTTHGSCNWAAPVITCNLAQLTVGASASIGIDVTSTAPGTATATATATFSGVDPVAQNNSAMASTVVRVAGDVSVEISDSADPVNSQAGYGYTVNVRNLGPNAGAVQVEIPLFGATVSSVVSSGGTCTNTASTAACNIGSLVSGATVTITVNATAGAAGTASAQATATFAGTDLLAGNNSAAATTTISAPPPSAPPAAPPSSPPGSGGGGGGGRFDWLFAGLLGLLAMLRQWRLHARGAA